MKPRLAFPRTVRLRTRIRLRVAYAFLRLSEWAQDRGEALAPEVGGVEVSSASIHRLVSQIRVGPVRKVNGPTDELIVETVLANLSVGRPR